MFCFAFFLLSFIIIENIYKFKREREKKKQINNLKWCIFDSWIIRQIEYTINKQQQQKKKENNHFSFDHNQKNKKKKWNNFKSNASIGFYCHK